MESLNLLDHYKTHSILRNLERNPYYSNRILKNKYDNIEIAIDKVDEIITKFEIMFDKVTVDKLAVNYNDDSHLFLKVESNDNIGIVDYFYIYTNSTTLHLLGAEEDDEIYKVLDSNKGIKLDKEELIDDSPLGVLLEDEEEGIGFAHQRDKKVYMTLNMIPHNKELAQLPEYIEQIKELKLDALIISDPGVFSFVKKMLVFTI